jgi:hypothetical protein
MVNQRTIRLSSAADSVIRLQVLDVDHELRVYQDGIEVFDAQQGQVPREHSLNRASTYVVRYNNNDGGTGRLHFVVEEKRTEAAVRFEVNRVAIQSPDVQEFLLSFQDDPMMAPPA